MKFAIVTGGSKGLGKEIVAQLAQQDWKLVELSRSGITNHNIRCNLANQESVCKICPPVFDRFASEQWSKIVLINNAAVLQPIKFVENFTTEEISNHLTVNQTSAFIIVSEFTKSFRNHNANKLIINISSGAARKGYPGWSLYCASKAASENFIRALAKEEEYSDNPFAAINYNPGIMDTDMQASIRDTEARNFPLRQRFVDYKEDGDLNTPQIVATHLIKLLDTDLISGESYSI